MEYGFSKKVQRELEEYRKTLSPEDYDRILIQTES